MQKFARIFLLLAACAAQTVLASADKTADTLKSSYQNHLVGVRYPIHPGDEKFDTSGRPVDPGQPQDWEFYGGILVKKLSLKNNLLRLEGPRVAFADPAKGKKLITISAPVKFEIRLDHPLTSVDDGKALLNRIFYLDEHDLDHMKPEYRQKGTNPNAEVDAAELMGKAEFVAPKPVYTPEPEFSEEARRKKYQGTVMTSIVIDKSGNVTSVRVEQALGYGLDQKAVEYIRRWRFQAARRNGQPVSARLKVEVEFHLF
ncbi:MAG TPA: energy transducer TonB [Candidatus Angelobacter sp.]|nr:energy transducer TonB [Candidatus Angelobacter sp.]